jgi:MFS family permease
MAWGWRLPFLGSAALVGVGLWVRLKLTETPDFAAAIAHAPPPAVPLGELLRLHWRETVCGTLATICCFAVYYLMTAFALGYGVITLGHGRTAMLSVQLGAILFMAAGIVAAGYWSDATSPRRVLMAGCAMSVAVGALLPVMMGAGSLLMIFAFLSLGLLVMGFVYGPLGAFLPDLFPARVRYTGASAAFNLGGILGGGLAPMLAQALAERGGLAPVGVYLAAAAALSFGGLWALKPKASAG